MKTFKQHLTEVYSMFGSKANGWRDTYDEDFPAQLEQEMMDFLNEKFGGKAWFKGGSYAYLVDADNPTQLKASDGSVIKVQGSVIDTLEKYVDRDVMDDFANTDPLDWHEFFRPVKNTIPNARDGAPMYGSEQGRHELANLQGESIESLKKLAGI